MENTQKVQSKVDYKKGTILFDDVTGEVFEVVNSVRIGETIYDGLFGLTLKEVKKKEKVQ